MRKTHKKSNLNNIKIRVPNNAAKNPHRYKPNTPIINQSILAKLHDPLNSLKMHVEEISYYNENENFKQSRSE